MNPNPDDYAAYTSAPSTGGELSRLSALAEEQVAAEKKVSEAEAALKKAQDELKVLAETTIPELMDAIGIEEFKTSTGLVVRVSETIRAAIPKPVLFEALAWLRANNHGSLIKRVLSLTFGKGEDDKADEWAEYMRKQGMTDLEDKAGVHPSTLSSFVATKLKDGEELPQDLLGVFRQRSAQVEIPKAPKPPKPKK